MSLVEFFGSLSTTVDRKPPYLQPQGRNQASGKEKSGTESFERVLVGYSGVFGVAELNGR